jgi:hypothetical protein
MASRIHIGAEALSNRILSLSKDVTQAQRPWFDRLTTGLSFVPREENPNHEINLRHHAAICLAPTGAMS